MPTSSELFSHQLPSRRPVTRHNRMFRALDHILPTHVPSPDGVILSFYQSEHDDDETDGEFTPVLQSRGEQQDLVPGYALLEDRMVSERPAPVREKSDPPRLHPFYPSNPDLVVTAD